MATMSVSGIVSGMDWEGMISTMIEAAQKPAKVQMNKRINLTNKKTLFEEMQELATNLQKSTTALRLESTYKAKKVETERIDSNGSAKGVLTAKVNADAEAGVYTVKVNQLAQAETRRSVRVEGNSNDLLKEYAGETLWFTQNGQRTGITISDTETLESLSSKINNTVKTLSNPMTFTASVVDGRLIFKSDESGLGNVITSNEDAITYTSGQNTILPITVDTANLSEGDFIIKDDKGNTYTNGVHFDIVDGNQIRWRTKSTDTIKFGDEYKLEYFANGDVYTSGSITRGANSLDADVLDFTIEDVNSLGTEITITDQEGFTYTYGTDFTIDGKSILWSKDSGAKRPDEGISYQVNLTAGKAAIYSTSTSSLANRLLFKDRTGNRTVNGTSYFGYDQIANNLDELVVTSPDKTKTYVRGTDYYIRTNGGSNPADTNWPVLQWMSTAKIPSDGFTATYGSGSNAIFDITATRGNTDTLNAATTTAANAASDGNAEITVTTSTGTTTYTEGVNFNLGKDANGNITVNWLQYRDAPLNGVTYDLNMTTSTGTSLHLKGVKTTGDTDATSQTVYMTRDSGGTVYYEGVDFTLSSDAAGNSVVNWNADSTVLINPGDAYTLKYSFADGSTTTYNGRRESSEDIYMGDYGFTYAEGSITGITYGDTTTTNFSDLDVNSITSDDAENATFTLNWGTQTLKDLTAGTDYPAAGAKLTYEYRHSTNTFDMDDGGTGLLQALGFKDEAGNDVTDSEYYTAAQNAEIEIDGEAWSLASNELDYDNDILKGVKLELKGTGTVIVDVTHDTEKAVENVQTFIDDFNILMDWINVRSSEKQVNNITSSSDDEDTVSSLTRTNDEFNTSWGLLYGNSYLRSTKSGLRQVVSQNFTFNFKERESLKPVYGNMAFNGLKSNTTLRITVGDRYANITITPEDTLQTIAAKINDNTKSDEFKNEAYKLHYDDEGNEIAAITAKVVNDKLVIKRGSMAESNGSEVTLSGSAALNALNLNYTYKGLYQIGIETTSDNYGISGQLDFSADEFREALEDNPDEVQTLMTSFAKQMDAYMKSMLNATSTSSGTLKTQISNIDTQITSIDEYLNNFQDRLDRMETRLRNQYAAAEERIAKLSQQASSIAGILSQMSGANNSNSNS
ncbi:MAG: flagellar filament capping protein FliD [Synergistaceae bacterium]|nr:flagellar filament capping protein FliD [Synergistaceae bacterium]